MNVTREPLIKYVLRHTGEYDLQDGGNVARGHGVRSDQHPRLHGCRRYDYMEVIGRVESGTETENDSGRLQGSKRLKTSGTSFPDKVE